MGKTFLLAAAAALAFTAASANAETISNPTNNYSLGNLSGSLTGGNQTQYIGESFTASITGELTDFQFTLNTSDLQSLYAVVYAWNGTGPGAELWRSATIAGTTGLLDFTPTGVQLAQGQNMSPSSAPTGSATIRVWPRSEIASPSVARASRIRSRIWVT